MTPQVISLSAAGSTAWIPVDYVQNPYNINIAIVVSDTPNLTCKVEYTLDDIFNPAITPTAFTHATLTGLTSNTTGNITSPVRAIRLTVTAWTSGTATMTALQGVVNPTIFTSQGDIQTLKFSDFSPTLVASLAAGATADRTGDTVVITVPAGGHGIPATTYDGFKFFVPPTASLASGALASSVIRTDANVLTCTLPAGTPGNDFVGEAIITLPFLTAVDIVTEYIPANLLTVGSDVEVVVSCGGDTSANQKYWALKFGTSTVSYTTGTTVPASRRYGGFTVVGTNKQVGQLIGSSLAAPLVLTKDITVDQAITITMQVIAGSAGYAVLYDAFLRISR